MSKGSARGGVIELGGEPRINFLPGEIQERKDARRRRRSLFMLVILVGVLCGIGYVYSAQYATERQAALETEQQTTLNLLTQQAQFMDARKLSTQVTTVGKAITHVTRNEVEWRELIMAMRAELPTGALLRQWTFTGPNSQTVAEVSSDIFKIEVGGVIGLDLIVNRLAVIGQTVESLSAMPGVIGVNITSTTLLDEGQGYGTVLSVIFSSELYESRFSDGWKPGMTPIPEPTTPAMPSPAPESEDDTADIDGDSEGDQ